MLRWLRSFLRTGCAPPILVIDTETTGLTDEDRIVSFAAVKLRSFTIGDDAIYAVFNPERPLHPAAARVNGWDDRTLSFQELFAVHAAELHRLLTSCRMIVGHNVHFDLGFLRREFASAGLPAPRVPVYCTMQAARWRWPGESASLNACIARIGRRRWATHHNALEDAWLAANLFCVLHGRAPGREPPYDLPLPANFHGS